MKKIMLRLSAICVCSIIMASCNSTSQENIETQWLGDSKQEMAYNIEEQFQGFSRTMMEVSYRFKELYWAGQDQNWEYAEYQREHIEEAMEQGFVRRPERELSSRSFMTVALPAIGSAIESGNPERFAEAFANLTSTCNTCHNMEQVSFMTVVIPRVRNTVVYF